MRLTRFTKGWLAVAVCAVALTPAGAAYAGGGPVDPLPENVLRSTKPSPEGNPLSMRAKAANVCADARPIGDRGLITRNGETLASVKQFYSEDCNENYGYVWVWESFRNSDPNPYDVTVAVYNWDTDQTLGKRAWERTRQQEFWSHGTDTVRYCTSGVGTLRPAGEPRPFHAFSERRC